MRYIFLNPLDAERSIPTPPLPPAGEGLGFEMSGKLEIMCPVQKALDSLEVGKSWTNKEWTPIVKTELCKIGRRFGYSVYARKNEVDKVYRDGGEWLYDVTWLEYERDNGPLVDAHLVAECEWGNLGDIDDDFEKLLLARARVRLMIFVGNHKPGSKEIADRLAGKVREFKGSRAEDAWLLAAWEGSNDDWSFRYFTIEMNAAIPLPAAKLAKVSLLSRNSPAAPGNGVPGVGINDTL